MRFPQIISPIAMMRLLFVVSAFSLAGLAEAGAAYNMGPKECQECHEAEYDVWKKTPHFSSYKTIHRSKDAKKILKAIGGRSMKRSKECALCHYTKVKKSASAKARAKAGPSCESCHGAASKWRDVHNDLGGDDVKAADETAAHKKKRLADAEAAGMVASRMVYDIAASCMRCHGLANPDLKANTLATMLESGHPVKDEFEIVRYSQGKLRHRFISSSKTNQALDPAGTARLFIGGQAAAFVYASRVIGKTDNAKFKAAQQKRQRAARENLQALAAKIPAIKALLASPSDANGRKVIDSIANKDLSSAVAGMLPKKADYK